MTLKLSSQHKSSFRKNYYCFYNIISLENYICLRLFVESKKGENRLPCKIWMICLKYIHICSSIRIQKMCHVDNNDIVRHMVKYRKTSAKAKNWTIITKCCHGKHEHWANIHCFKISYSLNRVFYQKCSTNHFIVFFTCLDISMKSLSKCLRRLASLLIICIEPVSLAPKIWQYGIQM